MKKSPYFETKRFTIGKTEEKAISYILENIKDINASKDLQKLKNKASKKFKTRVLANSQILEFAKEKNFNLTKNYDDCFK